MLPLREYQKRSLEDLREYLSRVNREGAKRAFLYQTERPYRSVPQLPELPYVCLRIPTGGGKTLMACHTLGIVARSFLQTERTVCLWLVPSNTIREQTLAALRDRGHPYRQVLEGQFNSMIRVMDITEALYIQRSTLKGEAVVIISTLAALRVEDTEGRKVYESSGQLSHHFSGLPEPLKAVLDKTESGVFPHSLANVLRLWRPVVIMDEAHNARTPLSFDTLARFNPSCIVEFTATPEMSHKPDLELFASNVLVHVSAAELKAEEMIKLPIKLRTNPDWQEVIAEALQMQLTLEQSGKKEEKLTGEYLRPIVLFQAQPRSKEKQTLTVEVIQKTLIEDFKIPEGQIAVATGQTRQIEDVDLFDRACPIRFIITVYALKEGWDCSFAYILCSLAEISSFRAVEQILGRVLRLPGAKKKNNFELNCAYAFVASPRFIEAANALKDALIENGFQKIEAGDFVIPQEQTGWLVSPGPLFETITHAPDLSKLSPLLQEKVSYEQNTGKLTLRGELNAGERQSLLDSLDNPADQAAVKKLFENVERGAEESIIFQEKKDDFSVPWLGIRERGQLELFEESHFLDVPWNLAECESLLNEEEFPTKRISGSVGELDIDDRGKIEVHFLEKIQEQLNWLSSEPGWTVASLANWVDRQFPHPDIPQSQSSLFIHNAISGMIDQRGLTIERLAREKFRLRNAIETKIQNYRLSQHRKAYQQCLFGLEISKIEVNPEFCLSFAEEKYAPNWYYEGAFRFRKHYFKMIGELKSEGEELESATFLDGLSQVKYWVRNLERRKDTSFWLQTATDRFYPDFIAKLDDDRILVVEYKGEHLWSNDDSKEKRAIGDLWADRSGGKCLFVMTKGRDWSGILKAI
jgi:type III restriction enzyme